MHSRIDELIEEKENLLDRIEEVEKDLEDIEETYHLIDKEDFQAFQRYCLELWGLKDDDKRKQLLYTLAFLPESKGLPKRDFDIL